MIRVWAVLLALAVAYAAALMVTATFAKATQQFGSHTVGSNPSYLEAAARTVGSDMAGSGNVVRLHNQNSSRFLSSGSEGSL